MILCKYFRNLFVEDIGYIKSPDIFGITDGWLNKCEYLYRIMLYLATSLLTKLCLLWLTHIPICSIYIPK